MISKYNKTTKQTISLIILFSNIYDKMFQKSKVIADERFAKYYARFTNVNLKFVFLLSQRCNHQFSHQWISRHARISNVVIIKYQCSFYFIQKLLRFTFTNSSVSKEKKTTTRYFKSWFCKAESEKLLHWEGSTI